MRFCATLPVENMWQHQKTRQLLTALVAIGGVFMLWQQSAFGQTNSSLADPDSQPATDSQATTTVEADPIADLNTQIQEKRKRVEELRKQAAAYQQAADAASGEVRDIQVQIGSIENQIAATNFEIKAKEEEVASLELEIRSLQQSIDEKNDVINSRRDELAEAIRQLDVNARSTTLVLVLTKQSLADFYSQAQATASISNSLSESIEGMKRLQAELQTRQNELSKARDDVEQSKLQLEVQRQSTVDQANLKQQLLTIAEKSADQYTDLLQQAALEEQQANATITSLERELQTRLQGNGEENVFSSVGYIWPVLGRDISAYFRDPTYPYRSLIGDHTGIDIRSPQGTPVRASADGIVSVVHDQGFYYNTAGEKTRSALNFVGLLHEEGLSTRYLHLSVVYVHSEQFVKQGDIIGLSGGMPGTAGAGGISSGPHLHFEVRENGLPVDPLKYLP